MTITVNSFRIQLERAYNAASRDAEKPSGGFRGGREFEELFRKFCK